MLLWFIYLFIFSDIHDFRTKSLNYIIKFYNKVKTLCQKVVILQKLCYDKKIQCKFKLKSDCTTKVLVFEESLDLAKFAIVQQKVAFIQKLIFCKKKNIFFNLWVNYVIQSKLLQKFQVFHNKIETFVHKNCLFKNKHDFLLRKTKKKKLNNFCGFMNFLRSRPLVFCCTINFLS